jgi:hypothetical protein
MRRLLAALAAVAACFGGPAMAQTADLVDRSQLRVCADPANVPFSNEKGEGFENKIAELLAKEMGVPVAYTWFPQAIGFVRNTLGAGRCDLVMGSAQGEELMQNTNHYYKSSYVLIFKPDGDLKGVESLDDPRLKDKAIGVIAGTPPATVMTAIDAGVLWGPIGGYYAKQNAAPLTVVPLVHETKGPRMSYRITMGMRRNELEWKHQINELIAKKQNEINAILLSYGVPLLDESDNLITH